MDLTLSSDEEGAGGAGAGEPSPCELCPPRTDDDLAWGDPSEPLVPLSCGHKICGACLRTHVQRMVMARKVVDSEFSTDPWVTRVQTPGLLFARSQVPLATSVPDGAPALGPSRCA